MKKETKIKHSKKFMVGTVVSTLMDKTATVLIERVKFHPVYKKGLKFTKKYKVHDEIGTKAGDKVRIVETRPISKEKRWVVAEVLKK